MKVFGPQASFFVDADSSVVKCLVLFRQGDGCRNEDGAGSIPVHSICCNVFTSFVLYVGLELDLGLSSFFHTITTRKSENCLPLQGLIHLNSLQLYRSETILKWFGFVLLGFFFFYSFCSLRCYR